MSHSLTANHTDLGMATISQAAPYNLDVTAAPDTMDLHDDGGFDFGDGDIDLDLRSTGQQDDDLSIYDANTDTGLEVQTVPTDQDDFMVDNEDVIEVDLVDYGNNDVDIVENEQLGGGEPEAANMEDDVIDYSDEEEDTMWNDGEHLSNPVEVETEIITEREDEDRTVVGELAQANDTAAQDDVPQDHDNDTSQHSKTDHEDDIHANDDDFQEFAEPPEDTVKEEDATTYIDQSNEAEAIEENDNENTHDQVDFSSNAHDDVTLNEQADQVPQELHLHPVTVNYDSAELWLFKYHDYDNSGDFLVEDEELASKPLSSVLEACRAALGSDVTDDMELGFRLDNFHNIELYQEHTSCAFITLEHLVNLYRQLHVQDEVSSPESFYMTLLFRPRVSALLNELSKAAAEGIGHSGLDRAIAAGLTAFNAHLSHNSTEHILEDWDDGEEQQEQSVHEEGTISEQAGHVEDSNEHNSEVHEHSYEEHVEENDQQQYEENRVEQASSPQVQSTGHATSAPAASAIDNGSVAVDSKSPIEDAASGTQPHVDESRSNSAHDSSTSHHAEDDIIDYSDEEAEPESDIANAVKATPPSSSSSTVQGANVPRVQEDNGALANDEDVDEAEEEASHGHTGDETGENFPQDEEHHSLYEGFDGNLGDEYVEGDEEVPKLNGELEEYPTEYPTQINDEDTNQYDDVDHENVEAPIEHGDNSCPPLAHTASAEDNLAAMDEFLDFDTMAPDLDPSTDDQANLYTGEDELEYDEDDKGGEAGQALVAVSAAAGPVDTLSSELLELSPQGQKRTIDEVGIDVGEATDSSGTSHFKRLKLFHHANSLDQTQSDLECRLPPSSTSSIGRLTNPLLL